MPGRPERASERIVVDGNVLTTALTRGGDATRRESEKTRVHASWKAFVVIADRSEIIMGLVDSVIEKVFTFTGRSSTSAHFQLVSLRVNSEIRPRAMNFGFTCFVDTY